MYDETQVRQHHLPGGFEILLIEEALGQLALLLDGEQREAVHGLHVGLEIGSRDECLNRLQSSSHAVPPVMKLQQFSIAATDCKPMERFPYSIIKLLFYKNFYLGASSLRCLATASQAPM